MKNSYWSCSKFADWLRGSLKPHSGTEEEWKTWEKAAKAKKIRYWLAEEGLDFLQNLGRWPLNLRHYLDNRWFAKTHALTSNLKRGQWHDFDTRLLHALFDELVNFVEIEQAWHFLLCSKEDRKKYKLSWYRKNFSFGWRCKEAGLAYLEWAAGLKNNEDWIEKNDPSFDQPTEQALAAQQTILLYKWWKEERPRRLDPMDASGLSDYYEKRCQDSESQGYELSWICCDVDEPNKEHLSKILKICQKMEQEQEAEDTEMLIRLIKIRGSLWT
ncbi:MAG: hypothetical protein HZB76_02560 [Chlamydiae bacterium]|nr:hypothetical protein [Chlamydiota bacterium]